MTRWAELAPEHRLYLEELRRRGEAHEELYRLELAERNFWLTPETHRLVYTRFADGGVSITQPTHEALVFMTGPGGYWNDRPYGFLRELFRRKTCPILQKGHPCSKAAALNFIKSMQWGGCTVEAAWDAIAQHDCARFGHSIEIHHIDDIPKDRSRRNEWRRSPNGGPIIIPEDLAA